MRKEEFDCWLQFRVTKAAKSDNISRCNRVEKELNIDLDDEFIKDRGKSLLYKLEYTRENQLHNEPLKCDIHFNEGSDLYTGMSSLRSAVKQYLNFCNENKLTNIVVLVSGGGTNLQKLIDAEKAGNLGGGKITCVISSKPDVYALERAKNNNIKSVVLERKKYPDVAAYSKAMTELLIEEKADLVVYAGFLTILDESVCKAFPYKMMNVHPALIPSFCGKGYYGLHVHEAVLEKGVKVTGATVHFVTEECDGGPIILQKAVEVSGVAHSARSGKAVLRGKNYCKGRKSVC